MAVFDLLAPDLRGALAGRGVEHDQESLERRVPCLGDVDERRGDGFAEVGRLRFSGVRMVGEAIVAARTSANSCSFDPK